MADQGVSDGVDGQLSAGRHKLNSWKEIANHLDKTVRTVQRWEKHSGLPVRRLQLDSGSTVFAYADELDEWVSRQSQAVQDAEETSPLPGTTQTPAQDMPASANRRALWLVAAVGALALLLVWLIPLPNPASAGAPEAVVAEVLTSEPGRETEPDISPDGRYVVYAWETEDGNVDLHLRMLDHDRQIALTNGRAIEEAPTFSPDGQSIAFLRRTGAGQREIVIIPALGGAERPFDRIDIPPVIDEGRSLGAGLDWSPDGRWLLTNERGGPGRTMRIVAIEMATGRRVALTHPPEGALDLAPAISPDGQHLAFTRGDARRSGRIHVVALNPQSDGFEPSEARSLNTRAPWNTEPTWSLDGTEILFASGFWPRTRIWRMTADGNSRPRPLAGAGQGSAHPSIGLSTNENGSQQWRLVYSVTDLDNDIHEIAIPAAGEDIPLYIQHSEDRVATSSQRERFADYSPLGDGFAFLSDRTGFREVWTAGPRGSNPRQFTDWQKGYMWRPSWSPDGSRLAYTVGLKGALKAHVQERHLGDTVMLIPDAYSDEDLAWSADGTQIYVLSDNRDDKFGIWAVPSAGGEPRWVTATEARPMGEDPMGRWLYLESGTLDQSELWRLPRGGTEVEQVLLSPGRRHSMALGPDGVYFVALIDGEWALRRWSFDDESEQTVLRMEESPESGISISPDGRHVLLTMIELMRSDLMLAEPVP